MGGRAEVRAAAAAAGEGRELPGGSGQQAACGGRERRSRRGAAPRGAAARGAARRGPQPRLAGASSRPEVPAGARLRSLALERGKVLRREVKVLFRRDCRCGTLGVGKKKPFMSLTLVSLIGEDCALSAGGGWGTRH